MKHATALALTLMQLTSVYSAPLATASLSTESVCSTRGLGLVGYWGQNSAGNEKYLRDYCDDSTYEVINVAFLNIFPSDVRAPTSFKPPTINLSKHCGATFPGFPFLLNCPDVGRDVQYCQSKGKKILLSLGGATGPYGFSSDQEARDFAVLFNKMFLAGSDSSVPRPLGAAVLDGIDLDIEHGSQTGYAAFIGAIRSLSNNKAIISAAPQCVFPDAQMGPGGSSAMQTAWFDMLTIQFYNNYCGVDRPSNFNFDAWQNWASTTSVNKNVRLYVGVPAAPNGAGSGYIPLSSLVSLSTRLVASSPNFAGVMLWEVSLAAQNSNYGAGISKHLSTLCSVTPPPPPPRTSVIVRRTPSPISTACKTTIAPTTAARKPTPVQTSVVRKPTPTSTTGGIVNGGACSSELGTCSGTQYAQCVNGAWLVRNCASGTVCKSLTAGGFVCDWP